MKKFPLLLTLIFCSGVALAQEIQTPDPQPRWSELTTEQHAALSAAVHAHPQGALVRLQPFVLDSAKDLAIEKILLPGPQYLFSDEPESVKVPEAVMLREKVEAGRVRLYVYHVNGFDEENNPGRKINSVIKNLGIKPLTLTFTNFASETPTGNYHRIGKEGLAAFLVGPVPEDSITVNPGEIHFIDATLEQALIKKNDLAHGFYEFLIDQPAEISVVMGESALPSPAISEKIPDVIPMRAQRNAGRGLFGAANYLVRLNEPYSTTSGLSNIPLADGSSDPWLRGLRDGGAAVIELKGNYGILYEVEVDYTSPDGKAVALVTWNPRADNNQWCRGLASALLTSEGKFPAGLIQVPSDQLNIKGPPEAVVIQIFPATEVGEIKTAKFTFSPTGASCLPMPLVLMPVEGDKKL
ncbi:MAG: copper amine oxidase [Sumerlaeia bacterium]